MKKRLFRIYPGLIYSVLLSTVFIFILYEVPSLKNAVIYFITQFSFLRFYTMDWLRDYGVGCPNGALWTIFIEIQFYFFVAVFYKFLKRQSAKCWIVLIVLSSLLNYTPYLFRHYIPQNIAKLYGQTIFPYMWLFMITMFIYNFKEKVIPWLIKNFYAILSLYIGCITMNMIFNFEFFGFSGKTIYVLNNTITITEVLFILLILASSFKFGKVRFKKDWSYPIYLLHYIAINIAVQLKFEVKYAVLFVIAFCFIFSWIYINFIEKQTSKLSKRIIND